MPRNPEEVGIGRGNGSGSVRTRFGEGQATNKGGRKKKERVSPSISFSQAVQRLLSETERVKMDGRNVELSRFDMLAHTVFEGLPNANFKERLALVTTLARLPAAPPPEASAPRPTDIAEVLADMAAEAAEEAETEELLRLRGLSE